EGARNFTDNGIHPTPYGFWRLASEFEKSLGLFSGTARASIAPDGTVRPGSSGIKPSALTLKYTASNVRFAAEDLFLLPSLQPPGPGETNRTPGLLLQFAGLKPGNYTLQIDGQPSAIYSGAEWAKGQPIIYGPAVEQIEELRRTIIKKNELFFYRWRPQNQTYLFGFRKYEQGKNAREIPMFDPLISEQEEKIFQLTQLKTRRYELAPSREGDRAKLKKAEPVEAKVEIEEAPLPAPTFDLGPDLEVTLWAENPHLAKPIQMNFDPEGRLWVASSSVYPQIQPGQKADDKILILQDTDHDGKADKTTVFTDGLLIPTGVVPGDGGAYVANSTELLFYKDNDGDGRADEKRIMLSGFGTEDTHHILHTLRWGYDGQLYMNQSIYIHSHIETPHGVVRLNSGGTLNLRPATQELGVHMKGLVNSWGHHFDPFGQSFVTDGAGGEGINWVIPQAMYVTYEGARRVLHSVSPGSYPKFCGLEVIESEHFPEDWRGTMVTCDFRAHRVVRFAINDQGAGYVTKELPDVMRSTNVTFRPIDVKQGPDGAIYIADWSNPIIQHGEVDFRDPRRDHEHGRIWRITHKGSPLRKAPDLRAASDTQLLQNLTSLNGQLRQASRRVLTERGQNIKEALSAWTAQQATEQGQLEALWMYQSIDHVNADLLKKLLAASDGRIRAAATRVLSFWRNRLDETPSRSADHRSLEEPLKLLAERVKDEYPRVRVEAVRAAAKIPGAQSANLILSALDYPLDRFLDYAIWLSINDQAEPWVKAIENGEWKWEGREKQLEFGLKAIEPALAGRVLAKVLGQKPLDQEGSGPWLDLIAAAGSPSQLGEVFQQNLSGGFSEAGNIKALAALSEAARLRQLSPAKDRAKISELFSAKNEEVRARALRLAGQWKLQNFAPALLEAAGSADAPATIRTAAFQSLREMGGKDAVAGLTKLSAKGNDLKVRTEAVAALSTVDLAKGVTLAVDLLPELQTEETALSLWRSLLANKGAAPALAQALPKSGLPAPVVKAGLRVAREGGRNEPNLVLALARNSEAEDEAKNLSPDELKRLLAFIKEKGDPHRGELIYRRQELGCVSCHGIGGVGGKVGPDMTSLGASAQLDYIIESVQFPNRKVKEGFHALMIETKDEQEMAGVLLRETGEQLILRDASNREISVPKSTISKRTIGGSIMPAGLIDALSEQEQADLYRFISELGKPGKYDASKGNVARIWQVLPRTLDVAQFTDDKVVATEKLATIEHNEWQPIMTLVDG
ncbi:MAG TPA: PVC-type heme-binding CxxCH protein, partial [Verrucomicrobiae bacterium]|nr:PVC-type heme-binding CxxCH protein [Verrucomicrobiae bacterium]